MVYSLHQVEALSAEMLKVANDIEEAKEVEISLRQQLADAEAKVSQFFPFSFAASRVRQVSHSLWVGSL
jgi:hypothetical protein